MASRYFGRDLAVDLGTANTLVYVRGRGVVVSEPSVVATHAESGEVVAVGAEAKQMIGRTPGTISASRPLKDGVIADFEGAEQMLRLFLRRVHRRRLLAKPRLIVCVPSGCTQVEQRAVRDAGYEAGARAVYTIQEPMAAAVGAGLPVHEAAGAMIVDVGGGTTEVAVISLGGIVVSTSIRTGGDELDQAIVSYLKKEQHLLVGERTAEDVKIRIGSAYGDIEEQRTEIRGRDLIFGLPRTIFVDGDEIRQALDEPVAQIVDAVRTTLDTCPPELVGDVLERGIVLTGGGALLRGLPDRLAEETGVAIQVTDDPLLAVAHGAGMCVEEFETLRPILAPESRRR